MKAGMVAWKGGELLDMMERRTVPSRQAVPAEKNVAIASLLGITAQGALVRSRYMNASMMDTPSKIFFSFEQKNGQRKVIHCQRVDDGSNITETAGIRRHATCFYKELFKSDMVEDPELETEFLSDLPQVGESSSKLLSADLTSPWRAKLALGEEVRPEWMSFYKPPLSKEVADFHRDMARSTRNLEREVVELQLLAESTGRREHIQFLKTKSSALADLLGVAAQGALARSRFQHITQMDAPSHVFFGLERKNGQRRMMHSLKANNGQMLEDPIEIRQQAVMYYRDLYRMECRKEPEVKQSFLNGLPQVGEEHNRELDALLSAEELTAALHGLAGGKSPGIDGLPAEFYRAFWPVLGEDLLCVLRDSRSQGRLLLTCRRAVLTLLPKKGDLQDIKNWCPVSQLSGRKEDLAWSTWRAEERRSGSSLSKGCCVVIRSGLETCGSSCVEAM
ncbi:Transposon TX1 uncharacterized 149 kDa protein ORF 2 [Takifugu flavidus]|uniref:Transposon TX1 uncharacterized 149 kDa protein ORF 2 n=1 Tax=Takifugu flavidus TaxID=433684 RepID=A0A5C6PFS2_9TELE|nr:Transposon TX1 uncharacterized 149 kDa protein ORF 2 [Takifugu flavidus]